MDSEIFKILVAIGFIALSVFSSVSQKRKKGNGTMPPAPGQGSMQGNQPVGHRQPHIRPEARNNAGPQTAKAKTYTPVKAPRRAALPEEGVRVTSARMAPNPVKKTNAAFKSKDELRRAIILGEVLAPKF